MTRRWKELTDEEKWRNTFLTNKLFSFLKDNLGKTVTWKQVNNALKLEHVYRWKIDDYNYTHKCTKISFDETGIRMELGEI